MRFLCSLHSSISLTTDLQGFMLDAIRLIDEYVGSAAYGNLSGEFIYGDSLQGFGIVDIDGL